MNDLASAGVPGRPLCDAPAVRAALRRGRARAGGLRGDPAAGRSSSSRSGRAVNGKNWHTLLTARWDALWYTRVAEQGYGYTVQLPNGDVHSNLAFFPLLPWLERGLSAVSPLSPADAGMVVAWLASLAAAWALYATGERLHGPRAGIALAALWAALPVGIVQSMAYSESLFTALAAWGVYAVLTGRWVWAGVLASLAGLTRPVGAAVVAAVWLTAAVTLWRQRAGGVRLRAALRGPPGHAARRAAGPARLVRLLPVGGGARQGSFTGYLDVQEGWGNGFDGGIAFAAFIWHQLVGAHVRGRTRTARRRRAGDLAVPARRTAGPAAAAGGLRRDGAAARADRQGLLRLQAAADAAGLPAAAAAWRWRSPGGGRCGPGWSSGWWRRAPRPTGRSG